MPAVSGKTARINSHTMVANWNIRYSNNTPESRTSASGGAPVVVAGNDDWVGSYRFHGKQPPVYPGASFTFAGHPGTGSNVYGGTAICRSVTIEADIEGAGIIGGTVEFEGNGALTRTSGVATDGTAPAPVSAKGCKVTFSGSDRTDVRNWSLTLTAELLPYNSSTTNGATARVVGNISAEFSWSEYQHDPAGFPAGAASGVVRLWVDGSTHFQLTNGVIQEVNPEHDIEGGQLVAASISGVWSAYTGGTQGEVAKPTGGNWYP